MEREKFLGIMHRVTGWGLLAYIIGHIIFVHEIAFGPKTWNYALYWDSTIIGKIVLGLIALALVFHTLNGIRIVLIEFGVLLPTKIRPPEIDSKPWMYNKKHISYLFIMTVIGVVLSAYMIMEMI